MCLSAVTHQFELIKVENFEFEIVEIEMDDDVIEFVDVSENEEWSQEVYEKAFADVERWMEEGR